MKNYLILSALLMTAMVALTLSSGCSNNPAYSGSTPTPTPSVKTFVTFSSAVTASGLVVDSGGNVYVTDYLGNELIKVTSAGVTSNVVSIQRPRDVAYDGTNFYFESQTSPYFYEDSGGVTTSPLSMASQPMGVAVNSAGTTLYVMTGSAGPVSEYSLPGLAGSSTVLNLPASGSVNAYQGIAVDASGNVYVMESSPALILKYAAGGSTPVTFAGTGTAGFADGAAASAKFSGYAAITTDNNGNIYVADTGNAAIREVSGGQVSTLVGSAGQSPNVVFALNNPEGIGVDAAGNVFIADQYNNRIVEYIP